MHRNWHGKKVIAILKCSKQHGKNMVALFGVATCTAHDPITLGMPSETYGPGSHVGWSCMGSAPQTPNPPPHHQPLLQTFAPTRKPHLPATHLCPMIMARSTRHKMWLTNNENSERVHVAGSLASNSDGHFLKRLSWPNNKLRFSTNPWIRGIGALPLCNPCHCGRPYLRNQVGYLPPSACVKALLLFRYGSVLAFFTMCVRVMLFPNKPSTIDAMSSPAKGPNPQVAAPCFHH